MKDFLKRPLELGDSVILIRPRYREFVLARITKFTAQKVEVTWIDKNYSTGYEKMLQDPHQLCKVDGPDLTAYLLRHA